jgi:hypothetical protein
MLEISKSSFALNTDLARQGNAILSFQLFINKASMFNHRKVTSVELHLPFSFGGYTKVSTSASIVYKVYM